MVIGNLFIGERYIDLQGDGMLTCEETAVSSQFTFKERGWTTNTDEINYVTAIIRDKNGQDCYSIQG